jgi:hypothetical protein
MISREEILKRVVQYDATIQPRNKSRRKFTLPQMAEALWLSQRFTHDETNTCVHKGTLLVWRKQLDIPSRDIEVYGLRNRATADAIEAMGASLLGIWSGLFVSQKQAWRY